MNKKNKLEIFRNILNNAINMNFSKEILLKISKKLDKYIVEYMQEREKLEQGNDNKNIKKCHNFPNGK